MISREWKDKAAVMEEFLSLDETGAACSLLVSAIISVGT